MSCKTHRFCPLKFSDILTSAESGFKLTLHVGWISEFIYQSHYRHDERGLATAHLKEFDSLSGICRTLVDQLGKGKL